MDTALIDLLSQADRALGWLDRTVLIDGAHLAALMIAHDLGVSVAQTFALKRLDSDFFAGD